MSELTVGEARLTVFFVDVRCRDLQGHVYREERAVAAESRHQAYLDAVNRALRCVPNALSLSVKTRPAP